MDRAKKQKGKIESLKEQGERGEGRGEEERKEGGKSHVSLAEKEPRIQGYFRWY